MGKIKRKECICLISFYRGYVNGCFRIFSCYLCELSSVFLGSVNNLWQHSKLAVLIGDVINQKTCLVTVKNQWERSSCLEIFLFAFFWYSFTKQKLIGNLAKP